MLLDWRTANDLVFLPELWVIALLLYHSVHITVEYHVLSAFLAAVANIKEQRAGCYKGVSPGFDGIQDADHGDTLYGRPGQQL